MAERVGQRFGNYHLIKKLGEGGFADVYLAEHTTLHTYFALKILHDHLTGEEIESFFAQIQTVAQLDHPHIIHIHEFGTEHNTLFLVMDYAPNGNLREHYPRGTQLPLSTVVSYVKQITSALQYIHDQDLIHRDIKPHNMLLGAQNEILLSDFGIAVLYQHIGYRRQSVPDFEGTIPYAAPEQIRGRPRIASDQYSLAIVAYQWLSGDWPFHGSISEIASQHTLAPPPSLREKVPNVSPAIEHALFRALAKNPEDRYEHISAFAKALEQASRLEHLPSTSSTTQPPSVHPPMLFSLPTKRPSLAKNAPLLRIKLHTTYTNHSEGVHAARWSPDGTCIASSSLDETVQIWDAFTGRTTLTYRSNSLKEQAIVWSPDSKRIASTTGLLSDTVQLWNPITGQNTSEPSSYHGHSEMIRALSWSPDGASIASASDDTTIQVWNTATKKSRFTYRAYSSQVQTLAWSPDGTYLASSSTDNTVHIINATNGRNAFIYYGHLHKVTALAWSPNSKSIASGTDNGTIHVWNATTGRKIYSYSGHSSGITNIAWSPDGSCIASSSLDETVQIWDASTGTPLYTYAGHSDWVSDVVWSPKGKYLASASWDKTVQVWELIG